MLNEYIEAGDDKPDEDMTLDEASGAITVRNTLMQQYLDQILDCVYDARDEVAAEALKLVTGIYDRGQVHPQHCISDLVGPPTPNPRPPIPGTQKLNPGPQNPRPETPDPRP